MTNEYTGVHTLLHGFADAPRRHFGAFIIITHAYTSFYTASRRLYKCLYNHVMHAWSVVVASVGVAPARTHGEQQFTHADVTATLIEVPSRNPAYACQRPAAASQSYSRMASIGAWLLSPSGRMLCACA